MSWHYRDPRLFPAIFHSALRTAAHGGEFELGAFHDHANVKKLAENFRWFRWCVREKPEVVKSLYDLEVSTQIRTKTVRHPIGYSLIAYSIPNLEECLAGQISIPGE